MDNVLFSALTMNTQPLHVNEDFASKTEFGQRLVNGLYTLGLVVGLTVPELTEGTIIANLGYDKVVHPNPVFHGDTIYAESEIIEMRESKSRPEVGIVKIKCWGKKPDGTIVVEFERTAMFLKAFTRLNVEKLARSTFNLRTFQLERRFMHSRRALALHARR